MMCKRISKEEMERRRDLDQRARDRMISEGGPVLAQQETTTNEKNN